MKGLLPPGKMLREHREFATIILLDGLAELEGRLLAILLLIVPVVFACASASEAWAAKPVIAVFSVEDKTGKLTDDQRQQLSTYLTSKIAEGGLFLVVPTDRIKARFRQQKAESYKKCYDQRCQIDLGRELAANKSLSTRIVQLGTSCIVTAVLFDLRKAASEGAASMQGPCTVEGLVKSIDAVATKLAKPPKSQGGTKKLVLRGGLLIKSTPPGAEVWIDGVKEKGVTPLTVTKLTADAHLLVVRKGKSQHQAMVQVKPDEFTTVTAALRQAGGRVSVITSPPEAKVLLDGKEVGQTPTIIRGISFGSHVLEIRKSGFVTERKTVKVAAMTEQSVELKLRQAGTVMVMSDPAGSTVFVDGQRVGETPFTGDVAPGNHSIRLEHRGRKPSTRSVVVVAGRKQGVSVSLELSARQAASLQLRTDTLAQRRSKGIWAYSSLALGLGLAVGAGVLYGIGLSGGSQAHDKYMAVKTADQTAMDKHYADVQAAGTKLKVGHVLAVASAIALAWAVVEFITRPRAPSDKPDGVEQAAIPSVGVAPLSGGGGVTFGASY